MSSFLRLLIVSSLLNACLSGCGDPNLATPDAAPDVVPTVSLQELPTDSHERMLVELGKIKQARRYERLFYGNTPIDMEEDELKYLPQSSTKSRFDLLLRLGKRRLWLGDTPQAIQHFEAAYALVKDHEGEVEGSLWEQAIYQLGLASLRLGENENCVNCNNGESCLLPIRNEGIHKEQEGSRNAVKYLTELLRRNPKHSQARWLLNIAHMTLGQYPDKVPTEFVVAPSLFDSDVEFPRFANIAAKRDLGAVNRSGGSIVDDFDGDNDLDILTSSWGAGDQILYFRNDGHGFTDATKEAHLTGLYGGLNLIQADYDNDDDIDVYVMRGAWMGNAGRMPNSLLQNDGTGRFRDVTFECGMGNAHFPTQTATWLDFDNDGDLDLYVGNETEPCQLFQNNGQGQFADVAAKAKVENKEFTKAVISGDYNNDDYPDLYVSNLGGENRLYRNNKDGTFTNVAREAGVAGPKMSFPSWFWDFNQDGALDLFVSTYDFGPVYVGDKYLHIEQTVERDALYQSDGKGGFRDVAREKNLVDYTQPMGSNFGDLDYDGYPDFYLGTGYPGYDGLMPNLMYWNRRGESFSDVSTAGGFGHLQKGHGIAFADIDHDGDQDVFAEMGGAFPGDQAANCLFDNPGFGNHWITIKLVGTQSNRSAIGTRITAEVDDAGTERTIYKWANSGGTFGGNPLRQEVGLGKAKIIDRLEIYWPTTQTTQEFHDVPVDQAIQIIEGTEDYSVIKLGGGSTKVDVASKSELK